MLGISATLFWGILAAVFLAAEAVTVGFASIWFCLGALITLFAAKAGASVVVQAVVFIVVSSALLVLTRPFVKKVLKLKNEATNADRIIGQTAVVVEDIDGHSSTGAVRIDGKVWSARCEERERIIKKDAEVKVLRIEGVKVIVK